MRFNLTGIWASKPRFKIAGMAVMGGFWIDLLGISAGCLTTGADLPQAVKALRTRHTADLSRAMYRAMYAVMCILVTKLRHG